MSGHDGYTGPVTLRAGGRDFRLTAVLGGCFQPLDGRYRWYGRLAADDELTRVAGDGGLAAVLSTSEGSAIGILGEPDLWRRYRIEGVSTPPFRIPYALTEAD
ncbi:DUF4873 domain-containing protein [Streptomyces sp. A7024]|uniref:DUF4873 domain-containing protein n=1 Tax=Streptomyces coryli TaxID=1128680 RepID=A0A6G4U7B3_9ACTN|nr:DUF4873 domain-containing protein [Streptomyces coryli]NGN67993.1 DUF4873 domain-containing protein [Streptomyces coryli]